jgi:hypothetical protein
MPAGFSSAARNLFLLGSSGAEAVTNFFKAIDKSSNPNEGQFLTSQIKYNYLDQKFLLSGTGLGNDSFGWVEKRDYNGGSGTSTEEWGVRINPTVYNSALTLTTIELDSNNDIIVVGKSGGVNGDYGTVAPYIAKYSNAGVLDWQSTSYTGDVEYTGVTSDSNGNYYACGNTPESGAAVAFVEKFDSNGNPGWGKSALMLGRDAVLTKITSNSRGEVVAVGYLEDDSAKKGYIVKIDSSTGEVLWDRTIKSQYDPTVGANPYQDVECKDIFIDSNGQIYIVGNKSNHGFIIKYTAEGNIIWQKQTDEGLSISFTFDQVFSDSETEQVVVFGTTSGGILIQRGVLSKYSKNGDRVWRRFLESSRDSSLRFYNVSLDADPSFYYLLFNDEVIGGQDPTTYTFGKVSTSGNGLGDFEYSSDGSTTIEYQIISTPDQIGRLSDGSVRNDTSDLVAYPFNANKILFDDLATHVSNKRRQMDSADSFEYSGGPAIRPADFQELNLLGDTGIADASGTDYTSQISGTQFNSSNPKEHAFDGNLNNWTTALNGTSLTWTPSGGLAVGTSLRLYAAREAGTDNITVTFTDTSTFNSFTADNTFKWYDITGAGGKTISNITWTHNNSFSRIAAIEVDGVILLDPLEGWLDQSGKGNDGVVNGATHNAAGYWEFDGGDDYIQLPTNSNLTFAGDFTYETWVWTDVQPASNTIWSLPNGQTFQFTTINSQLELIYYSNEIGNRSFGNLPNNTWRHYIITRSGNTITGYADGIQIWTNTGTNTTHNFSGSSIGYRTISPSGFYWDGRIGEVRIYPRALTAAQVFQNYNATKETYTGVAASTNPGLTSTRTP